MYTGNEVAIIGLAGRFPGAENVDALWRSLVEDRCTLDPVSVDPGLRGGERGVWVDTHGSLPNLDLFDAGFFGIGGREAAITDPQHRLLLEAAWEALEDGGLADDDLLKATGVYAGCSLTGYDRTFADFTPSIHDQLPWMLGNDKDYLTTRISHRLGLGGPSVNLQSACSTSLVAVHMACRALLAGECDAALAGGVTATVPRLGRYWAVADGIVSPDGRCRAFDASANGTVFSEGVAVALLMRLQDALEQRRHIHAVILGSAVNNDANPSVAFSAPSSEGQWRVIRDAYRNAELHPHQVGYIEAHGTGTVLGDAIELNALTRVFGSGDGGRARCGLGSIKTNIGHLSCAAGVAGLIKASLAVKHGLIPGNLHFETPNSDYDAETSPFFFTPKTIAWPHTGPRCAGVSSFGIGGTNAHIVVGEPPTPAPVRSRRAWHALPLTAKSEDALQTVQARMGDRLRSDAEADIGAVAYSQAVGRKALEHRKLVICTDRDNAIAALDGEAPRQTLGRRADAGPRTVAFLFPGQGSQYPGMGRGLYEHEPHFRRHLDECLDFSVPHVDFNLRAALLEADVGDPATQGLFTRTEFVQPALFALEYSLAKALEGVGIRPAAALGHSVGEFVAACIADAISLQDALRLVAERGRLMQQLPAGAMLSVAAGLDDLGEIILPGVDFAAFNAPGSCVLAGPDELITQMEARLTAADVPCRRLHTSHAFHSHMMDGALGAFAEVAGSVVFKAPRLPFISNVTGAMISDEALMSRRYWADQIRQPVRFADGIASLRAAGVDMFVEVGPGRSLGSLVKQCIGDAPAVRIVNCMPDARSGAPEPLEWMRALGSLWLADAPVDWPALYRDEQLTQVRLPTYPFERKSFWMSGDKGSGREPSARSGKQPAQDWFYYPAWTRLMDVKRADPPSVEERRVLILALEVAAGRKLAEAMGVANRAQIVVPGPEFTMTGPGECQLNPASAADWSRLYHEFLAADGPPTTIVHLWTLADDAAAFDADLDRVRRLGFEALQGCMREHLARAADTAVRLIVVTNGAAAVRGDEILRPACAGLFGFTAVVGQEHSSISGRTIDLAQGEVAEGLDLSSLAREIASTSPEPFVALRGGRRWARRFEPAQLNQEGAQTPVLKTGGVYLLVGGLGAIGLAMAKHLATKWSARLILTGRTALPERSEWASLIRSGGDEALRQKLVDLVEIETSAAALRLHRVDAADRSGMERLRGEIEEAFGKLDGVLYLAGVLTSSQAIPIEDAPDQLVAHFRSKSQGVQVLCEVFGDDDLDFSVVFSSISAFLGGIGHFAYSAANQTADALIAAFNQSRDLGWKSVNWDLWKSADLGEAPDGVRERLKALALSDEEGAAAFETLLGASASDLIVSTHPMSSRAQDWLSDLSSETGASDPLAFQDRPELDTPYAAPEGEIEVKLSEIWMEALGIRDPGRDDEFFELGGHSLMGVKMISRIRSAFGIEVSLQDAFTAPTIRLLGEVIEARLLEYLDSLSEEEAEAKLAEMAV
jgi:phthiocerol/phenolphthiocerol synthesis type-I polyketide synthase E